MDTWQAAWLSPILRTRRLILPSFRPRSSQPGQPLAISLSIYLFVTPVLSLSIHLSVTPVLSLGIPSALPPIPSVCPSLGVPPSLHPSSPQSARPPTLTMMLRFHSLPQSSPPIPIPSNPRIPFPLPHPSHIPPSHVDSAFPPTPRAKSNVGSGAFDFAHGGQSPCPISRGGRSIARGPRVACAGRLGRASPTPATVTSQSPQIFLRPTLSPDPPARPATPARWRALATTHPPPPAPPPPPRPPVRGSPALRRPQYPADAVRQNGGGPAGRWPGGANPAT